jgi:hypothetical protein
MTEFGLPALLATVTGFAIQPKAIAGTYFTLILILSDTSGGLNG